MKKLIILASLVIVAFTANAQGRYDRYDSDDYRRNGRHENNRNKEYGRSGRHFDPYGKIDNYQREARKRIAWGIETGAITAYESRKLLREVERIEEKEDRFLRDRNLSNWERRQLADDLADLNRMITHEKRDNDRVNYDDYGRNGSGRFDDKDKNWRN